jgi:hypothetical protein
MFAPETEPVAMVWSLAMHETLDDFRADDNDSFSLDLPYKRVSAIGRLPRVPSVQGERCRHRRVTDRLREISVLIPGEVWVEPSKSAIELPPQGVKKIVVAAVTSGVVTHVALVSVRRPVTKRLGS